MSLPSWIIVLLLGGVGYWGTSFLISEARIGRPKASPPPADADAPPKASPPPADPDGDEDRSG